MSVATFGVKYNFHHYNADNNVVILTLISTINNDDCLNLCVVNIISALKVCSKTSGGSEPGPTCPRPGHQSSVMRFIGCNVSNSLPKV